MVSCISVGRGEMVQSSLRSGMAGIEYVWILAGVPDAAEDMAGGSDFRAEDAEV